MPFFITSKLSRPCYFRWKVLQHFLVILLTGFPAFPVKSQDKKTQKQTTRIESTKSVRITAIAAAFYPVSENAAYTVSVCADLPVNDKPHHVFKNGEPGHVFFTLRKTDTLSGYTITRSFGFYPKNAVTFLVKKVRSELREMTTGNTMLPLKRK